MGFSTFNLAGIVVAAILAFAFGLGWHALFGKSWMTAAGYSARPAMKVRPYAVVFGAELVMAAMLAGITAHIGPITIWNTLVTGLLVWAGFTVTTMVVDHSFEARSRTLTLINAGHWLAVFVLMSVVIGAFG